MKRRLTIARALVNQPELLLLDEPTTGLDPQARHVLWDRLFRLKQQGVTLVLTTHYMDEAEQLCDRLVVMDGGRIVAEGSPRSLIEEWSTREVLELRFADEDHAPYAPQVSDLADRVEVLPDRLLLYAARRRGGAGRGAAPRPAAAVVAGAPQQPGGRLPAADRPDAGGLSDVRPPAGAGDTQGARDAGEPTPACGEPAATGPRSAPAGRRCGCSPTTCWPGAGSGPARCSPRSSRRCCSWSRWATGWAAWSAAAAGWSTGCPTSPS